MKSKIIPILFVVLVVLIGSAAYLYQQVNALQDPDAIARQEAEQLVAQVGKVILLPKDELPTIATVSDPTALGDQPFFAKAKVGDKVLLYPQARKAYLFDPVANKVLEVAPINLGDVGEVSAPTAEEVTPEESEDATDTADTAEETDTPTDEAQ